MSNDGNNIHDLNQKTLQAIQQRLGTMEQSQVDLKQRLDGVEHRLDGVEHRLDRVEQRLDRVERRLDTLEQIQAETLKLLKTVASTVETMSVKFTETLDGLVKAQRITSARLNTIEQRLALLEEHTGLVKT